MKALTRNTLLSLPLALLIAGALPGQGWDFLDAFTLAFCFTYVGHWVEVWLLKIPGVLGWFAGGLWCYVVARWALLAMGRDTKQLPALIWGGLLFVALEFVVHGVLQASGKPNFYSGQLQEARYQ